MSDASTPLPCPELFPPVAGSDSDPIRVGSCEVQRPSSRSVSVCASDGFQSTRTSPLALSFPRSLGISGSVAGTPVAPASETNRAAESPLTPSRARVAGSAELSEVSPSSRQRPWSEPNTNRRLRTMGPPIPPPS